VNQEVAGREFLFAPTKRMNWCKIPTHPTQSLGPKMIQLDGSYLYNLGAAIHPLADITSNNTYLSVWL
jgi:hypothetical protein